MSLYKSNTISGEGTGLSPLGLVDDIFYYGEVSANVGTTGGNVVVSANVPNGYKFIMWLGTDVATRNSFNTMELTYNHNEPTSARIYGVAKGTTDNASCFASYLCIKEN